MKKVKKILFLILIPLLAGCFMYYAGSTEEIYYSYLSIRNECIGDLRNIEIETIIRPDYLYQETYQYDDIPIGEQSLYKKIKIGYVYSTFK